MSPAGGRAAWAVATVVRAGADAPCSPERSSHRLSAAGPRGTRDCQPGGGPVHPDRRWRLLTVSRPAGRAVRATASRAGGPARPDRRRRPHTVSRPLAGGHSRRLAGRGPTHPIAGATFALYGGQRAARVSESARRAGLYPTVSRKPPAAAGHSSPCTGPGPRPGRESFPSRARAVNRTVGPLAASPTCRRCRQPGRRGPAARPESRQDTRGPAGVGY